MSLFGRVEKEKPRSYHKVMAGFHEILEDLETVYNHHNNMKMALEEEKARIENQIENSEDEMSLCTGAMNKIGKLFHVD
jgi:predicted DNA-binding ArsR family transcriptional regulator